jgi:hypothetical protein
LVLVPHFCQKKRISPFGCDIPLSSVQSPQNAFHEVQAGRKKTFALAEGIVLFESQSLATEGFHRGRPISFRYICIICLILLQREKKNLEREMKGSVIPEGGRGLQPIKTA